MYCIPVTSSWIVPAKLRHITAAEGAGPGRETLARISGTVAVGWRIR
jgi:hypothetical protein